MGSYGITALSGLSGALDRQDRRNDMQDQRDWLKESREMQRTQFKNQQEDRAAGAENREIALRNQKMQSLLPQADLERKQMLQKLDKSLRVIAMEGGNKNDHGKAMAVVLSTMHGKPIEYSPSEFTGRGQDHRGFQFKSQDGKIYSFNDYLDAKDKIGANFEDNYEFLRNKAAALNEEGLWVTQEGKLVQAKRGEAEKQGFTPYALVKEQGKMAAIGRKNRGTYKTVETDKGIVAYNEQNPNQQVALGRAPVSEADRAAGANANVKITKQFKDDLAFVLTPFAKPGMDMTALFDGGELTEPAKNALESAISFYERNSNVPNLPPQDKMKLQKAEDAIRLYNHMSQTVCNRYDLGVRNSYDLGDDGEDAQAMDGQPPVAGARQAPDGNWYVPDPNRPGKYMRVFMGGMR